MTDRLNRDGNNRAGAILLVDLEARTGSTPHKGSWA